MARTLPLAAPRWLMRELESSLQEFGEFLLKAQLARPPAAPYFLRWVRRFLMRPASVEPLTCQVRAFCAGNRARSLGCFAGSMRTGSSPKSRHSDRWRFSLAGRRTMSTAIKLREVAYPALFAVAA